MLTSDSQPSSILPELRATVERLHGGLETAFRELTDAVLARRSEAGGDAKPLYVELDGLFARYRTR